jgi:hypothetical protein
VTLLAIRLIKPLRGQAAALEGLVEMVLSLIVLGLSSPILPQSSRDPWTPKLL